MDSRCANLHVAHWNAHSICNKTLLLCEYMLSHDIDIMFLTETWLGVDDLVVMNEITLPGYTFINVPRPEDKHGGIGILYKSQLNLKLISDVAFEASAFEYAIMSDMNHSLHFAVIYRPPPSVKNQLRTSTFLTDFENFADCLSVLPGKLLLLGDFNLHFDCPEKPDVA